jgi:hypothetical protein
MTSLKLFYRRGASAALLLGLIVGAPDLAQAAYNAAVFGARAHFGAPYIPPHTSSLPNYPTTTGALSNPNLPPTPYARPTLPVLSNPNLPPAGY